MITEEKLKQICDEHNINCKKKFLLTRFHYATGKSIRLCAN